MSLLDPTPTSIRRAIWDGSIPCQILLNPSECRVFDGADPYYIEIPRISYLPLHFSPLFEHFLPFLIQPDQCSAHLAWLDFEGVPLKWHWPVGLLYDLLTGRDPTSATSNPHTEDEHRLPWTLTLHYSEYPYEHLMRLDREGVVQDAFVNATKEADYMRNGNARAVMSLSKADSTKLWESITTHNFDMYWSIGDKLITNSPFPIRHVPIKVYLPSAARVIQKLIPPQTPSREPITVGAAMRLLVPELFISTRTAIIARPVIHGVDIPMNTPLLEVMKEAIYPDGFLHIVVAMMS